MRSLSKSKIISYRQCPKRLWLEIHKPELKDDSASEVVFAIGNQVGDIAREIYDQQKTGHMIDIKEIGWDEAFATTAEWLEKNDAPLFEAAIRIEGALALADVMVPETSPEGTAWRMVEVKASGSVKNYQRDDLAVQTFIARQSGIPLVGAAIAHVDGSWVYPGGGDYQGLLKEVDLTEEVVGRADEVAEWIKGAHEVIKQTEEPAIVTGPHCFDPFACSFCAYCNQGKAVSDYPLSSFSRLGAKKQFELEEDGYTDARMVPDDRLNERNQWLKGRMIDGGDWFDAEGAKADLAPHTGVARFLDFETIAFTVPIWKGTRPYAQIPFQFSCHIQGLNGEVTHKEFLSLSGEDPREDFARALIDACGTEGPVFVYNAGFENRIMRELAAEFPEMSSAISAIIDRVVDLLPIARDRFYAPSQHGSWSLKAVLPAICPDLNYGDLEGVHNGGDAQQAYLKAIHPETTAEQREELRKQLIDYCKLDTYALVRVKAFFEGLI